MRMFTQKQIQSRRARSASRNPRSNPAAGQIHPSARVLHLQRTIGNRAVLRLLAVPPSTAQPLDAATRGSMEQRFHHGFGDVRVHTDSAAQASAAAEGALAYTAGRDVVFGAGQYRPHTLAGRWLIAHELAHVIQQRGAAGRGTGEGALEREAGEAGMRVALGGAAQVSPGQGGLAVQFLKVSSNGFGKALEDFTNTHGVKDKEVALLKKSGAFMKLVTDTLDKKYVWADDPIFKVTQNLKTPDASGRKSVKVSQLEIGPDGRVTAPATVAGKGMRAIRVTAGGGARFGSANAPPDYLGTDFISVDPGNFIQEIAHEATHAAAFVWGSAPPSRTLVAEIEAGIQDEVRARESEARILGQIPDPAVKAKAKTVGSRDAWQVERDVSPGANLTYLEMFFFSRELRDAQTRQRLTDAQAAKLRTEIDDLFGSVILKPSPGYGQTWFEWKSAERDWREFNSTHSPRDPNFAAEKEKLIQRHAKRFFKGKVSYRPHP